jgi:hypothetical protein
LTNLYRSCHDGGSPPSVESLQATLILILEAFNDVYIVLDALDECAERKDALKWIKEMTLWRNGKLHLLATSRPEEGIAKQLRPLDPDHIDLKPDLVTRDIERYIDTTLEREEAFERWDDEIKATIKSTLLDKAGGMYAFSNEKKCKSDCCSSPRFRLVFLQINKLQDCHNRDDLEDQLETLPCDLDDVYDRIISGISEINRGNVLKILQWLSFSIRSLRLAEIAQVTCVVPDADQGLLFKPSRAFADPRSVLMICSSFVTEVHGEYLE